MLLYFIHSRIQGSYFSYSHSIDEIPESPRKATIDTKSCSQYVADQGPLSMGSSFALWTLVTIMLHRMSSVNVTLHNMQQEPRFLALLYDWHTAL